MAKSPKPDQVKTFVLDTNVLIHDAHALYAFKNNNVIIPITVIEELDHLKKNGDEKGRNARMVSRTLDGLRSRGKLNEGVRLDSGGLLRVALEQVDTIGLDNKLLEDNKKERQATTEW